MPHAITAMNGAHFLFAFGALAPMTWPSLKTARNTEANSGIVKNSFGHVK
jgi:hypothetical protein